MKKNDPVVTESFLESRLDERLTKLKDELLEAFRDYRDQILTKMDGVMSELENHRIEHEAIKNDVAALKYDVTDLKKDVKSLKKHFSN